MAPPGTISNALRSTISSLFPRIASGFSSVIWLVVASRDGRERVRLRRSYRQTRGGSYLPTPMSDVERKLLDNALDALDRLFDSKCQVDDVYALMYATAQALGTHRLAAQFSSALGRLEAIVRGGNSPDVARELALDATNDLRIALADALPVHRPRSYCPTGACSRRSEDLARLRRSVGRH